MSSYDDPPVSPDYKRRRQQLEDAHGALRLAMQLQSRSLADMLAEVTHASVSQRARYRQQLSEESDRVAYALELTHAIATDTIALMIWDEGGKQNDRMSLYRQEQAADVLIALDLATAERIALAETVRVELEANTKRALSLAAAARQALARTVLDEQDTHLRQIIAEVVADALSRASLGEP